MRTPRYIRVVLIAQTVNESTSEAVKGICENLAYVAEGLDMHVCCAEAHEISDDVGGQYFSMWRS
jgi:hypothetical protein